MSEVLFSSCYELLTLLKQKNIQLYLDEKNELKCKAPAGAMTQDILLGLKHYKVELIGLLNNFQQARHKKSEEITPKASEVLLVERGDNMPLSNAEKRFWLLHFSSLYPSEYNISIAYQIKGNLNKVFFLNAFHAVIRRHEILRTQFFMKEGVPYSRILQEIDFSFDTIFLENAPSSEVALQILQIQNKPFDLCQLPLFKAVFIENIFLEDEKKKETYLVFLIHHIICDGWSVNILISELFQLYENLLTQNPLALSSLTLQYIDYALWHDIYALSEPRALPFWLQELKSIDPLLNLSALRLNKPIINNKNKRMIHAFEFDEELSGNLKKFAKKNQMSIFNVFLGIYGLFLYFKMLKNNFAVGVPVANRQLKESEDLIGCFINTVAVRFSIDENLTFLDYFFDLKEKWKLINAYHFYPFEQLVEALNQPRQGDGLPIFQTLFTYQVQVNEKKEGLKIADVSFIKRPTSEGAAKFPFQLTIFEEGDVLRGEWEWQSQYYQQADIIEFTNQLCCLTNYILKYEKSKINECLIFSLSRKISFLSGKINGDDSCNAKSDKTKTPLHKAIQPYLFSDWYQFEDRLAIKQGDISCTYKTLYALSDIVTEKLALHVNSGDRVALLFYPSVEMIATLLSVVKLGAIYIPLHADWPASRIEKIIALANVNVICVGANFSSENYFILNNLLEIPIIFSAEDFLYVQKKCYKKSEDSLVSYIPSYVSSARSIFYIIFTSGSTGEPKGASVFHEGVINLLDWYIETLNLNKEDKVLIFSSFAFDLTQKNIWAALTVGACIHLPKEHYFLASSCFRIIDKEKITRINCAPTLFYSLLDAASELSESQEIKRYESLKSLKTVVLGGEAIYLKKVQDWFSHTNTVLLNSYGPTECTDVVSFYAIQKTVGDLNIIDGVPLGKPINNTTISIVNDQYECLGLNEVGEIMISGLAVGGGYYNCPELTKLSFIDMAQALYYKTGDLGYIDKNGLLYFISRKDDQVKIRGLRIELSEVETALLQCEGVTNAVVCVVQEKLIAFLIGNESIFQLHYRQVLIEKLPVYSIPEDYLFLMLFPHTSSGKVNRKALIELYEKNEHNFQLQKEKNIDFQKIASEIILPLSVLWRSLLNRELALNESFFANGGNSFLALTVLAKVEEIFGARMSLSQFFVQDTLAEQASFIEKKLNNKISSSFVHIIQQADSPVAEWVFIHPILGDLVCYKAFLSFIPPSFRVLGVECYDQVALIKTKEVLFELYARELVASVKGKKISLIGYSLGGLIALGLVPYLQERGVEVNWLLVIDSQLTLIPDDKINKVNENKLSYLKSVIMSSIGDNEAVTSFFENENENENENSFYSFAFGLMKDKALITNDFPFLEFQKRLNNAYFLNKLFLSFELKKSLVKTFFVIGSGADFLLEHNKLDLKKENCLMLSVAHHEILNEECSRLIYNFIA